MKLTIRDADRKNDVIEVTNELYLQQDGDGIQVKVKSSSSPSYDYYIATFSQEGIRLADAVAKKLGFKSEYGKLRIL